MRQIIGLRKIDLAIALYAALLVSAAATYIWMRVSPIPYWDQWEFIITAAENRETVTRIQYLFSAHSEHIIATSKLIYYADLFLFGGRNLFSIAMIYMTAVSIAFCYTNVAARGILENSLQRITLWLAVAACVTALVQWENLIWGFQPQFYLVMLGVFATTMLSYRYIIKRGWSSLAGLAITIPFSIFSMGSGVLVVIPILFLLIALRDWRRAVGPIVLLVVFIAIFAWIVPGASSIGDASLRTPKNLLLFFLAIIGGPLNSVTLIAVCFGLIATLSFAAWGIIFLLMPWLRRDRLDDGNLILAAFALYLFATAGAASYARVTLGVDAALASRYSTPMIMIWLTLIVLIFRTIVLGWGFPRHANSALAFIVVLFATFLNMGITSRNSIEARYTTLQKSAFSVASGVETDAALVELYPVPDRIRRAIAFLRDNRRSIFADKSASVPADLAIEGPDSVKTTCAMGNLDSIERASETALTVEGWIAHPVDKRAPDLVLAFAPSGPLLGFTTPMTYRHDVVSAIRRKGRFRGFTLPANLANAALPSTGIVVVALFGGLNAMACRLTSTSEIPFVHPASGTQKVSEELAVETTFKGETASPGLSPQALSPAPFTGATVHGTFVNGDRSTGKIEFAIPDTSHQCQDVALPMMRGPTWGGLDLIVSYPDGISERIGFSGANPHSWTTYIIPGSRTCRSGSGPLGISVTDASGDWGGWVATARPRPRIR